MPRLEMSERSICDKAVKAAAWIPAWAWNSAVKLSTVSNSVGSVLGCICMAKGLYPGGGSTPSSISRARCSRAVSSQSCNLYKIVINNLHNKIKSSLNIFFTSMGNSSGLNLDKSMTGLGTRGDGPRIGLCGADLLLKVVIAPTGCSSVRRYPVQTHSGLLLLCPGMSVFFEDLFLAQLNFKTQLVRFFFEDRTWLQMGLWSLQRCLPGGNFLMLIKYLMDFE